MKTFGIFNGHKVCNDSIDSISVDNLLKGEMIDIYYSDPPWGDGNLKYWATMNKKDTGAEYTPLTYDQLVDRIFQVVKDYVDGYVMIETGMKWEDQLIKTFYEKGLFNIVSHHLSYSGGLPNVVVCGQTRPSFQPVPKPVADSGYTVVKELIGSVAKPGQVIADLCCGMGYTAQAAIDHGLRFIGNEFNEKRLGKTIMRLSK